MFEKEAEEYQTEKRKRFNEYEQLCWGDVYKDWKNGAEFGYNKANEWHFVKDGDLPKENQLVMLYRVNPLGANIAITNWYDSYKDTKVIAWKEIILPKLPKGE